ncbi:MAG: proline dehydrogenase [Candidatus Neomarinimicrobiota bacterium]|nr:MAG: proline dehydrogenase [Candidatus Neomarinimicrobiota bacterium]
MNGLNTMLAGTLSYFPRWFVKPFARPYVAGETFETAAAAVRTLNTAGFLATLDILGEHVHSRTEAEAVRDAYTRLYRQIQSEGLQSGISLKLTHLGLELDPDLARENLLQVLEAARATHNFLRIDMENSPYTDATLDLYQTCRSRYPRVGTVLQAYLHRTLADIQALGSAPLNVRICKGIYRESPQIAYQDREEIRNNYVRAVQAVLNQGGFVAIATHDLPLIDRIEQWLVQEQIPTDRFEFQVLYGVPMQGKLEQLLEKGYTVRVYVPFGQAWFDYSIRRLKENPHIVGYVLKNLLTSATG